MNKVLLTLCMALAIHSSFAQQNYQSGTVVTTSGETISGDIDYREWKQNPEKITFRKNNSSATVTYDVNNLESFSVSGDVYRRAVIQVTQRSDNLNSLSTEANSLEVRTDTVFLQTIVSGPKSLYSFIDNVDHFYIPDGKGGYSFLNFAKFMASTDGATVAGGAVINNTNKYVVTKKEYIVQLKDYLKECNNLNLDDLKYDVLSLRKAFMLYYDCVGSKPEFVQKAQKEKIEIGLLAGVTNTTFGVNSRTHEILSRVPFSSSVGVTAGAFFDLVFPRQRGRISLNTEFMYSSYETEGSYRHVTSGSTYDDYYYNFGYSYVKMNNMMSYKFFTNSVVFFVNGGISNGIVLKEVNKLRWEHTFVDQKISHDYPGFDDTRKSELGFILGAGARKNRASLEVRVEKAGGPFRNNNYKADVMRYIALLGYRLK